MDAILPNISQHTVFYWVCKVEEVPEHPAVFPAQRWFLQLCPPRLDFNCDLISQGLAAFGDQKDPVPASVTSALLVHASPAKMLIPRDRTSPPLTLPFCLLA